MVTVFYYLPRILACARSNRLKIVTFVTIGVKSMDFDRDQPLTRVQHGIVRLTSVEQKAPPGGTRDHAAVTAFLHWFAASARKIRSVERETRCR